jgi:hypothetical protein
MRLLEWNFQTQRQTPRMHVSKPLDPIQYLILIVDSHRINVQEIY